MKDEYAKKKCSDFASEGFSCVPFYGCLAGEIITNGATLINTRGLNGRKRKKRSFDLGPLDAKCFCGTEICCRHPEYKDVPLEIDPATLKDASDDEKCIVTTPKPTTPKSFIKAEPTATPVKPTITPAKPTGITAKSTTEKAEPAVITDKPTTVKPTTTPGKPTTTKATTTKPTTTKPTTTKLTTSKPTTTKPTKSKPTTSKPTTTKPITTPTKSTTTTSITTTTYSTTTTTTISTSISVPTLTITSAATTINTAKGQLPSLDKILTFEMILAALLGNRNTLIFEN